VVVDPMRSLLIVIIGPATADHAGAHLSNDWERHSWLVADKIYRPT
jgi:hypothetical protein